MFPDHIADPTDGSEIADTTGRNTRPEHRVGIGQPNGRTVAERFFSTIDLKIFPFIEKRKS